MSRSQRIVELASLPRDPDREDELEALGRRRDDPQGVGELERVVGSFLQILESHPREHLVVATTNHERLLDEGLWRRFDEVLSFDKPTTGQLVQLMSCACAA